MDKDAALIAALTGVPQERAKEVSLHTMRIVDADNPSLYLTYLLTLTEPEAMLSVSTATLLIYAAMGGSQEEAQLAAYQNILSFKTGYGVELLSIPPDPDKTPVPTIDTIERNLN